MKEAKKPSVWSLTLWAVEISFAVFLLGPVLVTTCRVSAGPESADWPTQNHHCADALGLQDSWYTN